jgi:transposase
MTNYLKYSVGLDVSKDDFHACIMLMDDQQQTTIKASHSFANSQEGFKALLQWTAKHCKLPLPVLYIMEATGIYYEALAWHLHQQKCSVAVVLPNKARSYMQSRGMKSKNDKIDSSGLAQMGAEQKLRLWEPLSSSLYALRSLTRQHESLTQLRTAALNQLHAFERSPFASKQVLKQLKKMIAFYEKEMEQIKDAIEQLIDQDPKLKPHFKNISIIKGISTLTIATIIAETNGFAIIENQRQLASYAGYDVIENQSGKHVGKTKISKKGNSRIRRILHMPAFNVVRFQGGPFRNLFNRVFERTGIKMKGYVAVQRKLLQLIYHLWKKSEAFDSNFLRTSGNDEPKTLFPIFDVDGKKVVQAFTRTTQDGLPSKESPLALFPIT